MARRARERTRVGRRLRRGILAGLGALGLATATVVAQEPEDKGTQELRQAFRNLYTMRDSFDTRPVAFTIGGVAYRVPRNYIVTMDDWNGGPQDIVTLRVSLPDLKPITRDTVACFKDDPAARLSAADVQGGGCSA